MITEEALVPEARHKEVASTLHAGAVRWRVETRRCLAYTGELGCTGAFGCLKVQLSERVLAAVAIGDGGDALAHLRPRPVPPDHTNHGDRYTQMLRSHARSRLGASGAP